MTVEAIAGELVTAGKLPPPASWRSALYRKDAPGARLDSQPWARSWPEYLAAVFSPHDASARQFIANAWSERIPSQGAFLVPEQLRSEVMAYIAPAVVRPRAMVLPMGSLKLGVPYVDNPSQQSGKQALGGLTFSFTEDGAAIPPTAPGFGEALLQAQKLAALLPVPNELASDAAGALGDFIARVIAVGLSWTEDDYFIGGNGTGQPEGIINAASAFRVNRANSGQPPVLADVMALAKGLAPPSKSAGYMPGVTSVGWLVSASVFDSLLELYFLPAGSTPTSGVPTAPSDWLSLGDGHNVGPSMLGLPAFITDHQPAAGTPGDLALCDLRNYLIGDRMELTIERSAAGSGFVTDISNYRIRVRVDGRYWAPAQTTEAGQSVSPVVVLN
jgi:HK97 family phage major capsid protein